MTAIITSLIASALLLAEQVLSLDVFLTCVDKCDVYIDGESVHTNVSMTSRVTIPPSARLVAVTASQIIHIGDGYIEMWPDDDVVDPWPYVTQMDWLCSDVEEVGWTDNVFNDRTWPTAGAVDAYYGYTGKRGQRRIWSRVPSVDVYCRMWLPNEKKCSVSSDADKISCAEDDLHQGECERRGCCFEDTVSTNVPDCYFTMQALPSGLDEPVTSVAVPRSFGSYTLHKTADVTRVTADSKDNAVLGAYSKGSLLKCFRACVLAQCGSMYLHGSDDSCVLYRQEQPMELLSIADPEWAFYQKIM